MCFFFEPSIELKNLGLAKFKNGMMLYNMRNKSAALLLTAVDFLPFPIVHIY